MCMYLCVVTLWSKDWTVLDVNAFALYDHMLKSGLFGITFASRLATSFAFNLSLVIYPGKLGKSSVSDRSSVSVSGNVACPLRSANEGI